MIEFDSDRIENTAKELIDAIQTPQTIFEEKKMCYWKTTRIFT